MKIDFENAKIYVRPGSTDLRKGVTGLAEIIENEMKLNALSESVFLFCNKYRHQRGHSAYVRANEGYGERHQGLRHAVRGQYQQPVFGHEKQRSEAGNDAC